MGIEKMLRMYLLQIWFALSDVTYRRGILLTIFSITKLLLNKYCK